MTALVGLRIGKEFLQEPIYLFSLLSAPWAQR